MRNGAPLGASSALTKTLIVIALGFVLGGTIWLATQIPTADWNAVLYPAGRGIFAGHSPYEQPHFVNPPWGVLLLLPFAAFPPALSRGLVLVASAAAILYATWRLRPNPLAVLAFLVSPTLIGTLLAGNVDAFVQLGVFLPPAWGLLLLMVKPQIGFGVAAYYLIETLRAEEKRLVALLRTFGPVLLAYAVSALLFPIWVSRMGNQPNDVWNRSIFPYGIPIGLGFLYLALKRRNVFFAMASSVFFSPYLTFYSYMVVQLALLHEDVERVIRRDVLQVILCLFLWVIMLAFKL